MSAAWQAVLLAALSSEAAVTIGNAAGFRAGKYRRLYPVTHFFATKVFIT
jgi:hypothetical protein